MRYNVKLTTWEQNIYSNTYQRLIALKLDVWQCIFIQPEVKNIVVLGILFRQFYW